jgi:DNA polymerase-4
MSRVRPGPSVLHCDLDAFFAAVEQRDKPSLRHRPVVVGGLGPRGVVATASYEARTFGIRSAMTMGEARRRCPHAAFLAGRFDAYRATSELVMGLFRATGAVVEPISLDEAALDVGPVAGLGPAADPDAVTHLAETLRAAVRERTRVSLSIGAGTSRLVAKIASELAKPDGFLLVTPGTEQDLLDPLSVRVLPGVGSVTAERLAGLGVRTVAQLRALGEPELVGILGAAQGRWLAAIAQGVDERPVVASREAKSVSAEDTFDVDLTDRVLLDAAVRRLADVVCRRLVAATTSGRSVTLKVRHADFTTATRTLTLPGPTDHAPTVRAVALALLDEVDLTGGLRLVGVGVSGLSPWVQPSLFDPPEHPDREHPDREHPDREHPVREHPGAPRDQPAPDGATLPDATLQAGDPPDPAVQRPPGHLPRGRWAPGEDVVHAEHGPGWVWGAGLRRVTVRFETEWSGPGPIRTFAEDDPLLARRPPGVPAHDRPPSSLVGPSG